MEKNDSEIKSDIIDLITNDGFSKLPNEVQIGVINSVRNPNKTDGGYMGKVFGNTKDNAAMNIAFCICVLLVLVGIACEFIGKDYWNMIIPSITAGMGYMFGKGEK